MIDHSPFSEQLLQPIISWKIRLQISDCRFALVSQRKFDFSKLHRLKSRCSLEPVPKTRERRRRHRFENIYLGDQDLHDCAHTFECVNRAEKIARGKISLYLFELMQQLLEPQLVRLMNDDEENLIMLRRTRAWLLKCEQLLKVKITG